MTADVFFLLDILVEDWDATAGDVEIAPLPLLGTLADVVEAWRPHYLSNRQGRHEFMQRQAQRHEFIQQQAQPPKELATVCDCDYCRSQRMFVHPHQKLINEAAAGAAARLLQEEQRGIE